jgi:hypothetical protein
LVETTGLIVVPTPMFTPIQTFPRRGGRLPAFQAITLPEGPGDIGHYQ